MIEWKKQGQAIIGGLRFRDGRCGNVVIVGARNNPKSVALVLPPKPGEKPETVFLQSGLELLHPREVIDILCMQERAYGLGALPRPDNVTEV